MDFIPSPDNEDFRQLTAELFYRRACTIYGGTAEIQRNIIAKALFGL